MSPPVFPTINLVVLITPWQNPPEALDSSPESDFQEEAIVVTRQEEEVDPEDAAEFEREFSRMMAESLESRKFERKPQFDVPVPIRVKNRDQILRTDEGPVIEAMPVRSTMAFSLLTKKGKGQQVRYQAAPPAPPIFCADGDLFLLRHAQ